MHVIHTFGSGSKLSKLWASQNEYKALQTQRQSDTRHTLSQDKRVALVFGYIKETNVSFPLDISNMIMDYLNFGKQRLGLCVVGEVDSGKSTLCGRLFYDIGIMSEREHSKLEMYANELGKLSFKYAFYMDTMKKERERGVSIRSKIRSFYTKYYHFSIIDVPGHRDFIKNMICGTCRADVAILVVSAVKGRFEGSITKVRDTTQYIITWNDGFCREHAKICYALGIDQIIVCVNKMDDTTVQYKQERFEEIKAKLSSMLQKIGYKKKRIAFIPISAWNGDNIAVKSVNMHWYNGFKVQIKSHKIYGFTLLDALDKVIHIKNPKHRQENINKPFIMPVYDLYKIKGVGDVICGRIEQGRINRGDELRLFHCNTECRAHNFEIFHETVEEGLCGDNIGINVRGLDRHIAYGRHRCRRDILCKASEISGESIIKCVKYFTAEVYVYWHTGQLRSAELIERKQKYTFDTSLNKLQKSFVKQFENGYSPVVYIRSQSMQSQMVKILWKFKKKKRSKKEKNSIVYNPSYIEKGDRAKVIFELKLPIVVIPYHESRLFGRILIMDHNAVVMLGKVLQIDTNPI